MKLLHDSGNKMVHTGITVKVKGESGVVVAIEQPGTGKKPKLPRGAVWVRFGKEPKTIERPIPPEELSMHWGGKETETEHPVVKPKKEGKT